MSQARKFQTENRSVLKVLILGDGAVGKSCIMARFINNQFEENSFHTIGVEFLNKEYVCDGKTYTLQVCCLDLAVFSWITLWIFFIDLGYSWTREIQVIENSIL